MKMTNNGKADQMTHRIYQLEARNAKLEEVLEAARRILRTRKRLEDPLLMQLDHAVNMAEWYKDNV